MNMTMLVATVLATMLSRGPSDNGMTLVGKDGAATVLLPENASLSTRLAADELTNYVSRISGKILQVKVKGQERTGSVVIGTLKSLGGAVPAAAKAALAKTENGEASWTGVADGTLWFVGKDDTAEIYAVYRFLESKLGVRWFQARTKEDPGDYVPTTERIFLAPFEEFREPKFRIRRLDQCHSFGNVIPTNGVICSMRNGFQVSIPYCGRLDYSKPYGDRWNFYAPRIPHRLVDLGGDHMTFCDTYPNKTTFATDPDVFAKIDGKPVKGQQYCLSNQKLRDATAARIIKLFDRYGGDGQFVFGQQDTSWGWCECAACKALDEGDEPIDGIPNVSTRFAHTIRDIAAQVWAKYPNADLRQWAYHTYRQCPPTVRQDPRLKVCFCDHGRCYAHALDDPKCTRNVKIYDMLKKWLAVTPEVYLYGYLFCTEAYYSCNEYGMADDIRKYDALGMMGWKEEAAFSDSKFVHLEEGGGFRPDSFPSVWQTLYVIGHLLWDPTLDEKALVADAESKYYGAAYPAMKKYQDFRRELWANGKGCMGYPKEDERRPFLLDAPGAQEKLLGYLDEADRLAENAVIRHRVGRDRAWLMRYWVKPHEEFKAKMATAFKVPKAKGPVVIDGVGDEAAWKDAFVVPEAMFKNIDPKRTIPADATTTVRLMRDDANLYILYEALEPLADKMKMHTKRDEPVWGDDSVEVLLFPPAIENKYYQIGFTAAGGMSAETGPGGKAPGCFGVEAKGRVEKDRYFVEVRVPTGSIYPLKAGDVWRTNLCRSRVLLPGNGFHEEHYSISGQGFRYVPGFHPLVIGE